MHPNQERCDHDKLLNGCYSDNEKSTGDCSDSGVTSLNDASIKEEIFEESIPECAEIIPPVLFTTPIANISDYESNGVFVSDHVMQDSPTGHELTSPRVNFSHASSPLEFESDVELESENSERTFTPYNSESGFVGMMPRDTVTRVIPVSIYRGVEGIMIKESPIFIKANLVNTDHREAIWLALVQQ